MSSKNQQKTCSKKGSNINTSGSIQFDKLFRENSNRPSVSKSAGTVGKWGITSFTSIRSSNITDKQNNDCRKSQVTKRMKLENANKNVPKSTFLPHDNQTKINTKPKKFFKSRYQSSCGENFKAGSKSSRIKLNTLTANEVSLDSCSNILSENKEIVCTSSSENVNPPIVLRICKGTARFVCGDTSESKSQNTIDVTETKSNEIVESKLQQKSSIDSDLNSVKSSTVNHLPSNKNEAVRRTTRSTSKNLEICNQSIACNSLQDTESILMNKISSKPHNENNSNTSSNYDKNDEKNFVADSNFPKNSEIDQRRPNFLTVKSKDTNKKVIDDNEDCPTVRKLNSNNSKHMSLTEADPCIAEEASDSEVNIKDSITCKTSLKSCKDYSSNLHDKDFDHDWYSSSDDESISCNLKNDLRRDTQRQSSYVEVATESIEKILNRPTVTKKGSIFKTRSTGMASSSKRRALYKHKWCDSEKEMKLNDQSNLKSSNLKKDCEKMAELSSTSYNTDFKSDLSKEQMDVETVSCTLDECESSTKCDKNKKEFYTLVKNVKKAHQIQESGEFQEFNDDVEYILDTLQANNPNATRCLSAIRLATKCMVPAFRMHVRAHGIVAKFFKALNDAKSDQSLALCTATVMFVLSQDRLAMDLDRDCLQLMLNLLDSDASHKNALDDCGLSHTELLKNKERVGQLCADIQAQGHAKHLNLENITVGQLATETLLSLTSKRAGEWFKEEIRELGGLDYIIKTVTECYRFIESSIIDIYWNETLLDKLRKIDRCLRVLENVTYMNEENQVYLLKYNSSILVITLASLYGMCIQEMMKQSTKNVYNKSGKESVIRECLLATIKVLINLTHRFNGKSFGGKIIGSQNLIVVNSLKLLLIVPKHQPEDKRFDIMMLALIFLINLTEQWDGNKELIVQSIEMEASEGNQTGVDSLISLFYKQEELARVEEKKTDAILDGKENTEQTHSASSAPKSHEEFIEETVAQLLQKAGRHMEHTLIAAYVVLLLGYLVMDNKVYENLVRAKLPDGSFAKMVSVLQKFFNFMNLTATNEISSCGIAAIEKVINFLKISDQLGSTADNEPTQKSISNNE